MLSAFKSLLLATRRHGGGGRGRGEAGLGGGLL